MTCTHRHCVVTVAWTTTILALGIIYRRLGYKYRGLSAVPIVIRQLSVWGESQIYVIDDIELCVFSDFRKRSESPCGDAEGENFRLKKNNKQTIQNFRRILEQKIYNWHWFCFSISTKSQHPRDDICYHIKSVRVTRPKSVTIHEASHDTGSLMLDLDDCVVTYGEDNSYRTPIV